MWRSHVNTELPSRYCITTLQYNYNTMIHLSPNHSISMTEWLYKRSLGDLWHLSLPDNYHQKEKCKRNNWSLSLAQNQQRKEPAQMCHTHPHMSTLHREDKIVIPSNGGYSPIIWMAPIEDNKYHKRDRPSTTNSRSQRQTNTEMG